MAFVFLSHVDEDKELALRLAIGLEEAGVGTWTYEADSKGGIPHTQQSAAAIKKAGAVIVLATPHALASPREVQLEINFASIHCPRFIPVLNGMTHGELQHQADDWVFAFGLAVAIPWARGGKPPVPQILQTLREWRVPTADPDQERIATLRALLEGRPPEPRPFPPPSSARWRRARLPALATLGLGLVATIAWHLVPPAHPARTNKLVVGVMQFEAIGLEPDDEWIRMTTRDSLNAILTNVGGTLEVIAKEKIQAEREKNGTSEIQALEDLGVTRLISGTVGPNDAKVRMQVRIVKMPEGINEAVIPDQRGRNEVVELQNDIARQVLKQLGIQLSAQLEQKLFADRTNDTADAYRLLAESMGDVVEDDHSTGTRQHSSLFLNVLLPASAHAQDGEAGEAAIRQFLARYAEALSEESVDALLPFYVDISDRQRAGLDKYFANARDLKVTISNVDIVVNGEEALATFTRTDEFSDSSSGRPIRLEVRISSVLGYDTSSGWRIRGLKSPS